MSKETRVALVVDDEKSIHEMYEVFLKPGDGSADSNRDFEVLHAMSGPEAIAVASERLAEERPIPIAFVDLKMSPMDGIATIRELNRLDDRMVYVVVTGLPEDAVGELVDTLESIPVQVLLKPFDAGMIFDVAGELTEQWQRNSGTAV